MLSLTKVINTANDSNTVIVYETLSPLSIGIANARQLRKLRKDIGTIILTTKNSDRLMKLK
jgi:hypothetical protein